MALRDHSLDDKIITAARDEFMEKGFRDASVHKIAARAGTTTGAIYTRYKGKDELFCSLIQPFFDDIADLSPKLRQAYMDVRQSHDCQQILSVIKQEEKVFLDLLFRHHSACVLCFCRSTGSSIEQKLNSMMELKAQETAAYLVQGSNTELDLDGVAMLVNSQFLLFRQILEKGYSKEKAMHCIKTVEYYMNAGWTALFQAIF